MRNQLPFRGFASFPGWSWSLIILAISSSPIDVAGADIAPTEFLQAAAPAWSRARMLARRYSGTVERVEAFPATPMPSAPEKKYLWEIKQSTGSISVQMQGGDFSQLKKLHYVVAVNSRYAFQVAKHLDSKEWFLDHLDLGGDGSRLPMAFDLSGPALRERWICEHFSVFDHLLSVESLFTRPNCKVVSADRKAIDGREFTEVTFDCPYPNDRRKSPGWHPVQSGSLVLDPAAMWCVRSFSVKLRFAEDSAKCDGAFSYLCGKDGFPVLKEATRKCVYNAGTPQQFTVETTERFDLSDKSGSFSEQDFTLTAYGLLEPYGITWKKPVPRFIWIFVVGIAAAVIGVLAKFGARRLSRRSSSLMQ